ncbi:hypothetical protein CROQUDRAFT_111790 [Cronartium quercuum f. sp. fusiforme G11]|uniref:Uncharacterized protein n=1 Tax=Cronartium quercuum f. sp. fusiforme G11 TaxID=708437 RepID=A0A9P6T4X9_9BASI|nr:hypothetical protein CROQUDRAFT_111790 [Cronartium quercuum f. sp. fusiforme G11]
MALMLITQEVRAVLNTALVEPHKADLSNVKTWVGSVKWQVSTNPSKVAQVLGLEPSSGLELELGLEPGWANRQTSVEDSDNLQASMNHSERVQALEQEWVPEQEQVPEQVQAFGQERKKMALTNLSPTDQRNTEVVDLTLAVNLMMQNFLKAFTLRNTGRHTKGSLASSHLKDLNLTTMSKMVQVYRLPHHHLLLPNKVIDPLLLVDRVKTVTLDHLLLHAPLVLGKILRPVLALRLMPTLEPVDLSMAALNTMVGEVQAVLVKETKDLEMEVTPDQDNPTRAHHRHLSTEVDPVKEISVVPMETLPPLLLLPIMLKPVAPVLISPTRLTSVETGPLPTRCF